MKSNHTNLTLSKTNDEKSVDTTNLTNTPLDSSAVISLCLELNNHKTLTVLHLSHCQLSPASIGALGLLLGQNSSLLTLDLACNNIEHEGAKALAVGLQVNHTLTELDLRESFQFHAKPEGNDVSHILCAARENYLLSIVQALQINPTLHFLKIGPYIPFKLASALHQALNKNNMLMSLTSRNRPIFLTGENCHSFPLEGEQVTPYAEDTTGLQPRLDKNREKQIQSRINWAGIAILFGFMKANRNNGITNSILPLLPKIISQISPIPNEDYTNQRFFKNKVINFDHFIDSRFFKTYKLT